MTIPAVRRVLLILSAIALVLIVGCKEEYITQYNTPRESQERLLAAIVPHGEKTWWYFVTSGPAEMVAAHRADFDKLLNSLSFSGDEPVWTMPENWRRGFDKPSRFETLLFGDPNHRLELRISSQTTGDIAANVIRWRGQIGLGAISEADAKTIVDEKTINGNKVILVDMLGPGGGRVPSEPLYYKTPPTWKKVANASHTMRLATYEVTVGDKKVEVTVDSFQGGGDDLGNIERWRGQLKLPPANDDEKKKHIRQGFQLAGAAATYADIAGDSDRILGVLLRRDGQAWSFKMQGPKDAVASQQAEFDGFLQTVQFSESEAIP